MKLIHDSASFFLHLLLLAELFVQSSSRPVHAASLCSSFASVIHHLEMLMTASKKLPDLPEGELNDLDTLGHRLDSLPQFEHTAAHHFGKLKVNESLSQLYANTESFRLHVDWLKTAKHNNSQSSQPTEGASTHLLKISNIVKNSLQQISAEVPQSAAPSLPVVSTAFDTLRFSVEISERLQVFSIWSKRLLRHFQKQSLCSRR